MKEKCDFAVARPKAREVEGGNSTAVQLGEKQVGRGKTENDARDAMIL